MKHIGLTGNIGSGKSLVANLFRYFGIPVFEADEEGRLAYSDPEVKTKVIDHFGKGILGKDGEVDRKALALRVFDKKEEMKSLSDIIHPFVLKRFVEWSSQQASEYIIMESAILFEYGLEGLFDDIILVTAPTSVRLNRVMERDKVSQEEVLARFNAQWPEEWKIELSRLQIINDGQKMVLPQILKIMEGWGYDPMTGFQST